MRIRVLDRVLVAVAGIILVAACAGLVAQVFFGVDVAGWVLGALNAASTGRKIMIGVAAAILLALGIYCLMILFRHRSRKDKFVMQKLESGELAISLKTLESMVQKCVAQHDEIKTESIRLENQRDGLLIRIRGIVAGGISIPLTVDTLQKQVKQYVTACSGVEVKGVRIQIESSGEDAKDAPFLIEPPVTNRLPKGDGEQAEGVLEEAAAAGAAVSAVAGAAVSTVGAAVSAAGSAAGSAAAGAAVSAADIAPEASWEATPEKETSVSSGEAAAAVFAAAETMMDSMEPEDDRPIHQKLFSTQEEPCIMPMPPENLGNHDDSNEEKKDQPEESLTDEKTIFAKIAEEAAGEEIKGEDNA